MQSIDKSFIKIYSYNKASYEKLINEYGQQIVFQKELLFMSLGIEFFKEDVDPFLQNDSRIITNKMMLFISKYLMQISPLVIEIRNYSVQNIENDKVYFQELLGLQTVNNHTHKIVFAKYNYCWFGGILEKDTLNILCFPVNLRQIVKNIMLQIFESLNCNVKNIKETTKITLKEVNQLDSFAIIQVIATYLNLKGSENYLNELNDQQIIEFYESQNTIDWLLLDTYYRYQQQKKNGIQSPGQQISSQKKIQSSPEQIPSQVQKQQILQTFGAPKPSFAHLNSIDQNNLQNSRDYDQTLMKSMEKYQQSVPKKSFTKLLSKLKEEEIKEKQEKVKKINMANMENIGNENIELSKEQFIFMMEKFKANVVEDLKRQEQEVQPDNFLEKFLFKVGGMIEPYQTDDGQVDYHVRVTPSQLKELLSKYEAFYNRKIKEEEELVMRKKQEEEMNNFLQFQQLLEYYYQTNPVLYQELLDEYNKRLHQQLLDKMGLPQKNIKSQNQSMYSAKNQLINSSNIQQNASFNVSKNFNKSQMTLNESAKSSKLQALSFSYQVKTEGEVIASRYEKKISKNEYLLLKEKFIVSENMINFFIRYLEEKQRASPQSTLKALKLRIFYLTTTFFYHLTSKTLDPNKIEYESASHYTKAYVGKDNTIFDLFDLIVVPISITSKEFTLTLINLQQKEVVYFDTIANGDGARIIANVPHIQSALFMNPNLCSVLKFLEKEYNQKMLKNLNIFDWKFKYSNHEKPLDYKFSGLLLLLIVHNISLGNWVNIVSSQRNIIDFHNKLLQFLLQIGITANKKKELDKKFDTFPL